MNKNILVILLVVIGVIAIPLAWLLFPWAQSLSAIELSDGTQALLSPEDGTWIMTAGIILALVSFLGAIYLRHFYEKS